MSSGNRPIWRMPPAYLLGSVALMVALDRMLPGWRLVHAPWTRLGAVPIVLGFAAIGRCAWVFRQRQTTVKPFETSTALIEDGLYRLSRNPIYVGLVMILVGVAWLLGTATPWLVVPLFVVAIQRQFIVREEAMLAEKFGERYEQYRRRVRRWW